MLEKIKAFLLKEKHNGKLISTEYVGSKEKLIWECSNGHQWKASWNSIDHMNSWCPTCAKLNKPDIELLKAYASNKQGKLLTKIYKNNRTKMLWECAHGHQWAQGFDRSGKFRVIDGGGMFDKHCLAYLRTTTTHDDSHPGFYLITRDDVVPFTME